MLAGIMNLLVAGPIMVFGAYFHLQFIKSAGIIMFVGGCLIFIIMTAQFQINNLNGSYKYIKEADWKDQLW